MGREVRRVPPDWQHPKDDRGRYIPMLDRDYESEAREWDEGRAAWDRRDVGYFKLLPYSSFQESEFDDGTFDEWSGSRPDPDEYMPNWPEADRTHYQMYEDTTEGTPISPVMESPESLARWLADNKASAFAGEPAPYEHWLAVCKGSWAPSMVVADGRFMSGVEFAATHGKEGSAS